MAATIAWQSPVVAFDPNHAPIETSSPERSIPNRTWIVPAMESNEILDGLEWETGRRPTRFSPTGTRTSGPGGGRE